MQTPKAEAMPSFMAVQHLMVKLLCQDTDCKQGSLPSITINDIKGNDT